MPGELGMFDELADKTVAVRVHARRPQPDQHVAHGNVAVGQNFAALDGPDGKAREIVIARLIHPRHLGRFATDERTPRLAASFRNPRDDLTRYGRVELSHREVVEKEQRFGALNDKIVDAHRDEIDANRGVLTAIDRDFEFRPDAVIRRNENGVAKTGPFQIEKTAEASEVHIGSRSARRLRKRLDRRNECVTGIDIDPCFRIGDGLLRFVRGRRHRSSWHENARRRSLHLCGQRSNDLRLNSLLPHCQPVIGVVAALANEGNEASERLFIPAGANTMRDGVRTGRYAAIVFAAWTAAVTAGSGFAVGAGTDAAYTVGNYPVEATAANAVAAKQQALAEGQKSAFRSLLKRIVPVTAYKQLTRISGVKAADLVAGVTVRSERNSTTAYIASLDFSFQPDAVRSVLSQQNIPFIDQQAAPVTVVTALMQGNPPSAVNDTAVWRRAWTGLDLEHTITPVKIADLKADINTDTVKMLLAGDDKGLQALNAAYGTKLIVMAVAEPDLAAKKLNVTLAGRDNVGTLLLKRTYRISDGDLDYASQLAAVVALGVLEGRWKAVKSAPRGQAANVPVWEAATSGNGEEVTLVAEFVNSGQWDQMRTQLLDTPGIDALNIRSVSDRDASVSLSFPGGARRLANALAARGLNLINTQTGWILRSNY